MPPKRRLSSFENAPASNLEEIRWTFERQATEAALREERFAQQLEAQNNQNARLTQQLEEQTQRDQGIAQQLEAQSHTIAELLTRLNAPP